MEVVRHRMGEDQLVAPLQELVVNMNLNGRNSVVMIWRVVDSTVASEGEFVLEEEEDKSHRVELIVVAEEDSIHQNCAVFALEEWQMVEAQIAAEHRFQGEEDNSYSF